MTTANLSGSKVCSDILKDGLFIYFQLAAYNVPEAVVLSRMVSDVFVIVLVGFWSFLIRDGVFRVKRAAASVISLIGHYGVFFS